MSSRQVAPQPSSRDRVQGPGFDTVWGLSTRHQRFTCIRLLDSHLTEYRSAFSGNAHDEDS
ncbi:MAG: hypothetical protein O7B35_09695 [Deltaproteobacteria bacterium]|nr:hypothetical protein [Deltaproteobacteria bacterium]